MRISRVDSPPGRGGGEGGNVRFEKSKLTYTTPGTESLCTKHVNVHMNVRSFVLYDARVQLRTHVHVCICIL